MQYVDFSIHAWLDEPDSVAVMVHTSPVGSMRRPVTTTLSESFKQEVHAQFLSGSWYGMPRTASSLESKDMLLQIGQTLAGSMIPLPVWTLLIRSLERLGDDQGLRVRLCLDEALMDLPWEFLVRPDKSVKDGLGAFLIADARISITREAPMFHPPMSASIQAGNLIYAGAMWSTKTSGDQWGVHYEYERLLKSLEPVSDLLDMHFSSAADDNLERILNEKGPIFHYAGHADTVDGQACLFQEINDIGKRTVDVMSCNKIAAMVQRAGVRLVVLNSCNGGRWDIVKPFLDKRVAALIGAQGTIRNWEAFEFSARLYQYLALGFSLDEAIHQARMHLLELEQRSGGYLGWSLGTHIVYMPTTEPVIFPRPKTKEIQERQQAIIHQHFYGSQTTIYGNVDTGGGLFNSGTIDSGGGDVG